MRGPEGKYTKTTNFSKEQWDGISDIHVRDVWSVEPEKLQVIQGDVEKTVDIIRNRKNPGKRKANRAREANQLAKKARGSGYERRIASSDSDIWFVPIVSRQSRLF